MPRFWSCLSSRRTKRGVTDYQEVINRQSLLIDLSNSVLAETQQGKAVAKLVCTAQDVVNCDRIGFFMVEPGRGLVCQASPGGGEVGWVVEPGRGIVGKVALTGKTVNIADARKDPCFDHTIDERVGSGAQSVLCVGLKDQTGQVIAVMSAVNKRAVCLKDSSGTTGVMPMEPQAITSFDQTDEEMLRLLLALTNQQLRVLTLEEQKLRLQRQAESLLTLVGSLSTTITDVDACFGNLCDATRTQLGCQQVSIFFAEGGQLVCRARSPKPEANRPPTQEGTIAEGLRPSALMSVLQSGVSRMFGPQDGSEMDSIVHDMDLDYGKGTARPVSVLVSPLRTGTDVFGVVVAVNKVLALVDLDDPFKSTAALTKKLSQMLGEQPTLPFPRKAVRPATEVIVTFGPQDVKRLDVLLSFAAHAVFTAEMYSKQQASNSRLQALLGLCTESVQGLQNGDLHDVIYALCKHGMHVFQCERFSFYAVDPVSDQALLAWYVEDQSSELKMMRGPSKGIAGHCVRTGKALNISNAWADPRCCNEENLRAGNRTHTVLCHPITSRSGIIVAVLECVNKTSGRPFDDEDEQTFGVLSEMYSDIIESNMSEASMQSLMGRTDLHPDVKEAMRWWYAPRSKNRSRSRTSRGSQGSPRTASSLSTTREERLIEKKRDLRTRTVPNSVGSSASSQIRLLDWDLDYFAEASSGPGKLRALVPQAFAHFGLLRGLDVADAALQSFVFGVATDYLKTPYHNFMHAFVTFHLVFLMLAGLVAHMKAHPCSLEIGHIDRMAVLLAALGHDIGHRGFNNVFEIATQSDLAVLYNDRAPLENCHASATWKWVRNGTPSLVEKMPPDKSKRLRAVIIHTILRTDMALHSDHVVWLRSRCVNDILAAGRDQTVPRGDGCAESAAEASQDLCAALLHCADLGHPCMPWSIHKRFSLLACEELYKQFQEETLRGLPTLPFMGKDPNGPLKEVGHSQAGFVSFVVLPLWQAVSAFSNGLFQRSLDTIQSNKQKWDLVAKGEEVCEDLPLSRPRTSSAVEVRSGATC